MSSYRFVEQIDDRLRADLMELYRHEWWTNTRREEDVVRMLAHTDLVVGVCADPGDRLVGFARVLTDRAFKALIFDVIVDQAHRSAGLGQRLIQHVLDHPMLAQVGAHRAVLQARADPVLRAVGLFDVRSGRESDEKGTRGQILILQTARIAI